MLRSRLICGVIHRAITNRLLAEKELIFDKALELAQAMESAERYTQHLQSARSAQEVHHSTLQRERSQRKQPPSQSQGTQRTLIAYYRCDGPAKAVSSAFVYSPQTS